MTVEQGDLAFAIESAATPYHWSRRQWQQSVENDLCFGLRADDEWVAVSAYALALDEATLLNVAVLPPYQGRGLARQLLESGLAEMARLGAGHCFLEVRCTNQRAYALYESLGFTEIAKRRGYYDTEDGREDAVVMMCSLPKNGKSP